ncbi:TIR domain-containing protein [Citrobacter sp. wls827]|uniref:TIR domain-containing protein n=1 Tax=Citrobacter sp. wls827 TaxID=2576414 RepID=UPI0010C9D0A3|nr:TIR domain-containing protein [Citrobacter sp. wls827]TKU16507.1 hypothetical protein FDX03_13985 [Citrobacter sp. wls827]
MAKHNVFISYHHKNDQDFKEELLKLNEEHKIFIDQSVYTGDIDETLDAQVIREKIRDEYLSDSTVTILLVGTETKNRKHIDWELYSSMYDGKINKKSGVLVINLPTIKSSIHAAHGEQEYYPGTSWTTLKCRSDYEERHPFLPERIIDNLLNPNAKISVTNWNSIKDNPSFLSELIDKTFDSKKTNNYNLSREMRKNNS